MKKLCLLKKLSHTTYGANRSSLLYIYRMLIRSKLDYGAAAYTTASTGILKKLDSIHNSGIRLSTGALRSSPINSLLCEAAEWPLESRRKYLLTNAYSHTLSKDDLPLSRELQYSTNINLIPFFNQVHDLLLQHNMIIPSLMNLPSIQTPPWTSFSPSIDLSLCNIEKYHRNLRVPEAFSHLLSQYPNYKKIYTDASKTLTSTGCAIIQNSETVRIPLPGTFSILSAELYAIKTALELTSYLQMDTSQKNYLICTDSLSSLRALNNVDNKKKIHPIVSEIITLLQKTDKNIILVWVPAHAGISGNEAADIAAKEAAIQSPVANIKCPPSDFKTYIKGSLTRILQQKWKNQMGRNKLRMIKDTFITWESSSRPSRKEEVSLCRLRIGHTLLTHSYLFSRASPPQCIGCNSPLTVYHILTACDIYRELRSIYSISDTISDALGDNKDSINHMMHFLTTAKLINKL